jgi:hypothetical protein
MFKPSHSFSVPSWPRLAVSFALIVNLAAPLPAQTPADGAAAAGQTADTVRLELGKPLQSVQDLLKAGKGQEALARLRDVDALVPVANRSSYENYVIERMRGAAATMTGDADLAAKAFESVIAGGRLAGAEKIRIIEAVAGNFYRAKNFPRAADWYARYFKEGGSDASTRQFWIQAMFQAGDLDGASRELLSEIQGVEKLGKAPPEDRLQFLAGIYQRKKDNAGYAGMVDKLLIYYPKKEYWAEALYRVTSRPGFPDRLALEVGRLKLATGNLRTAAEFFEYAQISLAGGFSLEASRFLEQGFAANQLGVGDEGDRHRRLRALVRKSVDEDVKALPGLKQEAASGKDGTAMINVGYSVVLSGQHDEGLKLMERGLALKTIKRQEDARLLYGSALLYAGQKERARATFNAIQGDGVGELARLWALHAAAR